MPIKDLLADLGVLPLRMVAFQTVLLLVAIVLEAVVLRQKLKVGYRVSMQYAATLNLLATGLGWLTFLSVEPFLPDGLRTQVISYVLFNRFYANEWQNNMPLIIIAVGLASFFITFWLKSQSLEWLMHILEVTPATTASSMEQINNLSRRERYALARQGRSLKSVVQNNSRRPLAVLQANAISFSAIILLLLLRYVLEGQ